MDVKEFYTRTGGDYADILRRLHDEARILKYLSKFLEDSSFMQLNRAREEEDFETAFRAAHSLKGICMNLGLSRLQESSSALTENLRGKKENAQTPMLFEKTIQDYNEISVILGELLNSL